MPTGPDSGAPHPGIQGTGLVDWDAAMASAPFQQALRARRRFVLPATALFLAWYLGFVVLAGYAPGVLGM